MSDLGKLFQATFSWFLRKIAGIGGVTSSCSPGDNVWNIIFIFSFLRGNQSVSGLGLCYKDLYLSGWQLFSLFFITNDVRIPLMSYKERFAQWDERKQHSLSALYAGLICRCQLTLYGLLISIKYRNRFKLAVPSVLLQEFFRWQ